jgi:hypothetical protein
MADDAPILFSQQASWSIPILGPTIDFVTYDPVRFSLLVIYNDGAKTLLGDIGRGVTQQIIDSPNREDVVLSLLASSPHIGQPANRNPPQVSGIQLARHLLFAWPGDWDYDPDDFSFQWLRDGAPINGATDQWYLMQNADVGHLMAVQVIAINPMGSSAAVISV